VPPPWPLTARSEHLERISAAQAEGGTGGVVLTGPAGVGKTRLGEEVLQRSTDAPTARAVGHPATQPIPLGALAHLLPSDLARDLGTGEDDRVALFHRARAGLAEQAGDGRLLLLVDDVDQLDETSLAVLLPLTIDRTLFVVATLRQGRSLPDVLTTLVKDGHLLVEELAPLGTDAVEGLLDTVLDGPVDPAAARTLADRSGGNLQVLQELVWSALSEHLLQREQGLWRLHGVPRSGSLEELVASHVEGVDDQARAALDILAVAGSVSLPDLEALVEPEVLERLETLDLVRVVAEDRRTTVALRHPVYGEVISEQLTVLQTRSIQRRLADQLDSNESRRREDVTRLALWRLEGGGDIEVETLLRAGRLALAGRDADLAARFAAAAADRGAAARAAAVAVEAAALAADADAVERAVASVWDDPELCDDDRAHLARRLATTRFARGDLSGALDAVRDAEDHLDESSGRAAVRAQRAQLLAGAGQPRDALAVLAEIGGSAGQPADPRLRIEIESARSVACLSVGRFAEARAAARLAADTQTELPRWLARRGMATHLMNEAHSLAYGGWYREARQLVEQALAPTRERGAVAAQVWFEIVLGEIERDCGYGRAAVDHFETATALAPVAGQQAALVWAWVGVAQGRLLLGELDAAEQALDRADAEGDSPIATSWATRARTHAWLLAGRGDLVGARDAIVGIANTVERDGIWTFEASLRHDLVRFGDPSAAVARLSALAELVEGPLVRAYASHARAAASMDRDAFDEALGAFESLDCVVFAAETALEFAELLRTHGDMRGAAALARRSAGLVAAAGGARTPALLRGMSIEPLTRREREVALLAAGGATSKEIAQRLSVSKRTVDTHLDRVYRKLGVTSRDGLADAMDPEPTT
jgi:DNA-binding CsgD family transcriptional regulator/tetratricopeptide (TPR) repeat protein